MKRGLLAILVMSVALSGCVKKSMYEDQTKKLKGTQAELVGAKAMIIDLEDQLAREQSKSEALESELVDTKSVLEATKAALAAAQERATMLESELASTINDKAKLKESADKLKRALAELEARKAEADKRVKEFKSLLSKFKKLIDSGKLKVQIQDGRMVLVLPTDILFGSGSAKLSSEGETAIAEVATVLRTIKKKEFQVGGHTDNVPMNNNKRYKNNWALASARAMVVVETMIEAGMKGKVLSAASFGEYRPVKSNKTKAGKSANRRIDIVIVPDLSTLPGFSELKTAVDGK